MNALQKILASFRIKPYKMMCGATIDLVTRETTSVMEYPEVSEELKVQLTWLLPEAATCSKVTLGIFNLRLTSDEENVFVDSEGKISMFSDWEIEALCKYRYILTLLNSELNRALANAMAVVAANPHLYKYYEDDNLTVIQMLGKEISNVFDVDVAGNERMICYLNNQLKK